MQAAAVRDALKGLFSEPRLPDNPYYYLANVLVAYVDQSSLWKVSNQAIMSAYDLEGGLEVVTSDMKLCKLATSKHCYGMPHVLRMVSRDGRSATWHASGMAPWAAYHGHACMRTPVMQAMRPVHGHTYWSVPHAALYWRSHATST